MKSLQNSFKSTLFQARLLLSMETLSVRDLQSSDKTSVALKSEVYINIMLRIVNQLQIIENLNTNVQNQELISNIDRYICR